MPLGVQKFKIGCFHIIEVMGVGHMLTLIYVYNSEGELLLQAFVTVV
jgi:hypothetical protein